MSFFYTAHTGTCMFKQIRQSVQIIVLLYTFICCAHVFSNVVTAHISLHSCKPLFPAWRRFLISARSGPGATGFTVDQNNRPRDSLLGLRDLYPGRFGPLQGDDQHRLQLGPPRADRRQLGHGRSTSFYVEKCDFFFRVAEEKIFRETYTHRGE